MTKKRIACPMRHENGNCLPAGGFCTAVNDCICEALHNAFNSGIAALTNELIRQSKEAAAEDVAEIKRGHWIKNKPNPEAMKQFHELGIGKVMSEKSIFFTCSCCGSWGTPINKYCGICGAKMEGNTWEAI